MGSDRALPQPGAAGVFSPRRLGLVGQVATSWGVAGGLVAAVVVTLHTFSGNLSSSLGFLTTTVFFLAGSLIGYLHGGLLAYAGRPPEVDRMLALRRLVLAAMYAVPVMVATWLIAMLLAMSAAAVLAGRVVTLMVSAAGWVLTAAALAWAGVESREAVLNLFRRWPAARALFVAVGLAFLALLPAFLLIRPEVWVLDIRPTATTAVVMALMAAVWILGPLGVLLLLVRRAWARHHQDGLEATDAS